MKPIHRIRMFLLQRHADNMLRNAKQRRDHHNRPHQQSVHLVSYPIPAPPRPYLWLACTYMACIAAAFFLSVYVNYFHAKSHTEPAAQLAACSQIVASK